MKILFPTHGWLNLQKRSPSDRGEQLHVYWKHPHTGGPSSITCSRVNCVDFMFTVYFIFLFPHFFSYPFFYHIFKLIIFASMKCEFYMVILYLDTSWHYIIIYNHIFVDFLKVHYHDSYIYIFIFCNYCSLTF